MAGSLEFTEGEFVVSNSSNFGILAENFLEHGFFTAELKGFTAHVELDSTLKLSLPVTHGFNKTLVDIGLPGFQVGGFTPFRKCI